MSKNEPSRRFSCVQKVVWGMKLLAQTFPPPESFIEDAKNAKTLLLNQNIPRFTQNDVISI